MEYVEEGRTNIIEQYSKKDKKKIENPKAEDYREIFKKLDIVANDILEEEKEQILKDIARIIKKQAIPNIKEYVDNN